MGCLMSKFYQTKRFKDLERCWDKKLLDTGFADAERTKNGQRILKQASSNAYRSANIQARETRAEYYRTICYNAYRTTFVKPIDRLVMTMLADGLTIRKIVGELLRHGIKAHRMTVSFIIRRWEHRWGIRYWTLKERNLKYE